MEVGSVVLSDHKLVKIVSCQDARVIITKTPTGKTYEFARAGHEMYVDELDAEYLLGLIPPPNCCGGSKPTPYFELVR